MNIITWFTESVMTNSMMILFLVMENENVENRTDLDFVSKLILNYYK